MGRGSSFSGGGNRGSSRSSSSSRGSSRSSFSSGGSRGPSHGWGPAPGPRWGGGHHHTTVFIGGGGSGGVSARIIPAIFLLFFGIPLLFAGISFLSQAFSWGSTYGTCRYNDNVGAWYYTTYSYTVKGEDYISRSDEGWEFPEDVGATVKIYYKKSNPSHITENVPPYGAGFGVFGISLLFNGIAIALIVSAVKHKKQGTEAVSDSTLSSASSSSQTAQPESDYEYCSYCGGTFSKTANKCPHCGAKKMR